MKPIGSEHWERFGIASGRGWVLGEVKWVLGDAQWSGDIGSVSGSLLESDGR